MFGYVRPSGLSEEESLRFRRVYCGLCHTLKERYGVAARFILNYDFTFLAILLSEADETPCLRCRCIADPIHRRELLAPTPALALAADESVILAYWQLRDGVSDHGFFSGLKYRLLARLLRGAYRRARLARPEFDCATQEQLRLLCALEKANCPSLDEPADCFARLLCSAAQEIEDESRRRVLGQMLYHLGRWIYLVDAADDLKKDRKSGNYNPLMFRFSLPDGVLAGDERQQFSTTLDHSIRLIEAAYELQDFGCWTPILSATVYRGLFEVGKAVLDGNYHKRTARKRKIVEDKV